MALHRLQTIFQSSDLMPEHSRVNTTYWDPIPAVPPPDPVELVDMVWDFYNLDAPSQSITDFYGAGGYSGLVEFKLYDMSEPEPRRPVYETSRSYTPIANQQMLPHEVALCVSFQADPVSGVPQARRRGRIYLGPLAEAASSNARPSTSVLNVVEAAAQRLLDESTLSVWKWQVYSRTGQTHATVTGGWIDNAWDTQRRRGNDPTARLSFGSG